MLSTSRAIIAEGTGRSVAYSGKGALATQGTVSRPVVDTIGDDAYNEVRAYERGGSSGGMRTLINQRDSARR